MSANARQANTPATEHTPERISDERVWMRRLFIPLTVLAWVAVLGVVFWLAGLVAQTVILIALAVLIAYALTPVVNRLTRWMPRWVAIVIAYLIFGGALVLLIYIIAGTVATEVTNLVSTIHSATQPGKTHNSLSEFLSRFGVPPSALDSLSKRITNSLPGLASQAVPIVSGVASSASPVRNNVRRPSSRSSRGAPS